MTDQSKAKDALQESLMKILSNIDKYDDRGAFKSWISTVTARKNLEILRKEKSRRMNDLDSIGEIAIPSRSDLRLEQEDILAFMNQLPDNYRITLNMYLVEGFSHKEIAETLGISEGTSRSLVSRGRQLIKVAFKEYNPSISPKKPIKKTLKIAL